MPFDSHQVAAAFTYKVSGLQVASYQAGVSTIRNADRIPVFEGSRIIEPGTFEELMRRGGHFAELAKSQFMEGDMPKARREQMSGQPVET